MGPDLGAVASWKACSGLLGCVGVVQTVCVVVIFFISGLTLKTDEVKRALTSWPDALFGVVSILLITPLLALLPTRLRFLPAEFQVGFLLFCSMPTTINSGVALVGTGRGNVAMALLLTLASNLLGVFTVPFSLSLLLQVSDVRIDASPLLAKLMMMILLPLLLGKAARDWSPRLRERLKQRKQLVSNGSSLLLCLIPREGVGRQAALRSLSGSECAALFACGAGVHAAIVIMGSQKTLPMAMTVLSFFPPSLGEPGLIALPCIVSHLLQIFADAFLVARQPRCRRDAAEIEIADRRTRLPRREAVGHRPRP
ncbi:hypothetical protein EMIHUDRAFT_195074 [Emiliania huxleyi CCMP1516]|uniref:Uncharacterized protein n=2 Tax=Emiliania huxleyi TaxID=2903 RepID=A0A0D3JGV6_EMIH1|nr:hypothetical protein EMIHUDRAFT_195074 [Emiliania huxleyi CCMP1516]EOD22741.1 hypothetical protein EMIHUDRAFT_195074 [Emiliania huxleyi CCMP1516]|eukprot:XP_005775170.1 hypothetical protein EMIHUDRAFT_195074 [Emiliania huxleyi CCMP1516]